MDKTTVETNILNGQTPDQFVALLFWGLIGFICSILIERTISKRIKTVPHLPFGEYVKENIARFLLSIMAILIGVLFTPDLLGRDISNFSALLVGLGTDKIIEILIKLKSLIGTKDGTDKSSN